MTYKQLASTFYTINPKYRISWECAELLIELGDVHFNSLLIGKGSGAAHERAVTLAGDKSRPSTPTTLPVGGSQVGGSAGEVAVSQRRAASPPLASPPNHLAWRASTGRYDLSHRQLVFLREMLHHADSASLLNSNFGIDKPVIVGVVTFCADTRGTACDVECE